MPLFPYKINVISKKLSKSSELENYLKTIHEVQQIFKLSVEPILNTYFSELSDYKSALEKHELDVNYHNPMIYTEKEEYFLHMLLIEYSNQYMKSAFDTTPAKVVLLPRCLTGPNFDLLKIKRTKVGWHRILGCKSSDDSNCEGWLLTKLGKKHGFDVYITMGKRFNEPNFLKVFKNLRKKLGHFGLIAVACIPELALGKTYIMEMGIPTQAVPLFYSGCAKWHGEKQAVVTEFPLRHVIELLKLKE
ncbi:MAG: DUF116 domain-containing protein [Candidatus Hodarchaeota archaeon]